MKEGNQSLMKVFDITQYLCPVLQQKVTGSEINQKMKRGGQGRERYCAEDNF